MIHCIRSLTCDTKWVFFPRFPTPRHVSKGEQVRDQIIIRSIGLHSVQCLYLHHVMFVLTMNNRDDIHPIFVLLEMSRQKDFLPYVLVPNFRQNIYEKHYIVYMNSPSFHRHILFDQRLVYQTGVYETVRGN
jgi:hypothetical protein